MPALFFLVGFLFLFLIISLLHMVIRIKIEYCTGGKTKIQNAIIFPRLPKAKNSFAFEKMTLTNWSKEQKIKSRIIKHILIDELIWNTVIGMEDAMYTALSVGGIWACKGALISHLKNLKRLKHFEINVKPDFSNEILLSELECIIKLRIGHIITIVVQLLNLRIKEQYLAWKTNLALSFSNKLSLIADQIKKWGCWHGDARGKAKPSN